MPGKILVVDDDPHVQYTLREALKARGLECAVADKAEAAIERLQAEAFDAVLLDIMLEGLSGMEALPRILRNDPQMPVIMMTAYGTREMAVKAIEAGAYDFFEKPFQIDELAIVVRRALERRRLFGEVAALTRRLGTELRVENLVAESRAMQAVLRDLKDIFDNDATVLLLGETGTGKTLIAQIIHENSLRRSGPFETVLCANLPETLLESELFGHEQGAFTGPVKRKPGWFELANGGTIFLDEIGELPLSTQAKLLRVLERHECVSLGGTETLKLDVRVIAAPNRNLEKAVEEGAFRQDLFYRLNVFPIVIPPLRERREDIRPLAEHFVRQHARENRKSVRGFTSGAMEALLSYDWPGNIRELENIVRRAVLRARSDTLDVECLPPDIASFTPRLPGKPDIPPGRSLDEVLDAIERQLLLDALRRTGGVQSRAAALLRITSASLWHRVRKLGINPDDFKAGLEPAGGPPPNNSTPRP